MLSRNIALNQAGHVHQQQLALGDSAGNIDLYLYKDSNRGRHSVLPVHDGTKILVPVTRLDSWWQSQNLAARRGRTAATLRYADAGIFSRLHAQGKP